MTPSQFVRSKQFKILSAVCAVAVTVVGLIRCVPSDQAVVTDSSATERVKEAEAAEEAEAAAMKVAHGEGEDEAKPKTAANEKAWKKSDRKPASAESKKKAHAAHPAAHTSEETKVVMAPAKPKAHAPAKAEGGASMFAVQVGAFHVKENAEKLSENLKSKGFAVKMESIEHSKNGELHLVRLEPTADRTAAETSLAELKEKMSVTGQIVKVPAGG